MKPFMGTDSFWKDLERFSGKLTPSDRAWLSDLVVSVQKIAHRISAGGKARVSRGEVLRSLEPGSVSPRRGRPKRVTPMPWRVRQLVSANLPSGAVLPDENGWAKIIIDRAANTGSPLRLATTQEIEQAKRTARADLERGTASPVWHEGFNGYESQPSNRTNWPRYFLLAALGAAWGRRFAKDQKRFGPSLPTYSHAGLTKPENIPKFVDAAILLLGAAGLEEEYDNVQQAIEVVRTTNFAL